MKNVLTMEEFKALPKAEQDAHLKAFEEIQKQAKANTEDTKDMKQLTMADLKTVVSEAVTGQISKMTKVDKKFNVFPGIGDDPALINDLSPEGQFKKSATFLRALVSGDTKVAKDISLDVAKKANLSEGTATEGGFLVPEEFKNEILRLAPNYGVLRANCRIIPMKRDIVSIPAAGSTDQSAIWTQEAKTIKQTDPNFKQVQLVIAKLGALPKFSNEVLADSDVGLISYLTELIAEQFAKAEDKAGFMTGAPSVLSPFVGMMYATGAPSQAQAGGTISALSYPDLVNFTQHQYSNILPGCKFYFHRSVLTHLRSLITTTGAAIFGAQTNSFVGYPAVGTEILPSIAQMGASSGTGYGIFGDVRRGYAMGERGTMQLKVSTEATVDGDNLFAQDMTALRVIERVAMAVLLPSAFTVIKTA